MLHFKIIKGKHFISHVWSSQFVRPIHCRRWLFDRTRPEVPQNLLPKAVFTHRNATTPLISLVLSLKKNSPKLAKVVLATMLSFCSPWMRPLVVSPLHRPPAGRRFRSAPGRCGCCLSPLHYVPPQSRTSLSWSIALCLARSTAPLCFSPLSPLPIQRTAWLLYYSVMHHPSPRKQHSLAAVPTVGSTGSPAIFSAPHDPRITSSTG